MSRHNEVMNDAKVKQAIRTLKAKGVTIQEIDQAYRYFEQLGKKNESMTDFLSRV